MTPASLPTEDRDAFLAHVAPPKRGTFANWFLYPIRAQGATTPSAVVSCVVTMLQGRITRARAGGYPATDAAEQLAIIVSHMADALAFAAHYLAYERLPESERAALKQHERETHRAAWMADQPPTEKQLGYLRSLGYAGAPPESMDAASQAIDRLLAARGKAVRS